MEPWYILWQIGIVYGTLVYFMANWYILWQIGIFYGNLVYFMAIWYIRAIPLFSGDLVYFPPFFHEKSRPQAVYQTGFRAYGWNGKICAT
jgi:hypothetical protein